MSSIKSFICPCDQQQTWASAAALLDVWTSARIPAVRISGHVIQLQLQPELGFSLQRLCLFIWIRCVGQMLRCDQLTGNQTGKPPIRCNFSAICCFQHPLLDGCCSLWTCTSDCLKQLQIMRKSICGTPELKRRWGNQVFCN